MEAWDRDDDDDDDDDVAAAPRPAAPAVPRNAESAPDGGDGDGPTAEQDPYTNEADGDPLQESLETFISECEPCHGLEVVEGEPEHGLEDAEATTATLPEACDGAGTWLQQSLFHTSQPKGVQPRLCRLMIVQRQIGQPSLLDCKSCSILCAR